MGRRPVLHRDPVNWESQLNRGLVSWWLPLSGRGGSNGIKDIAGKYNATFVSTPTWAAGPNGFQSIRTAPTAQKLSTTMTSGGTFTITGMFRGAGFGTGEFGYNCPFSFIGSGYNFLGVNVSRGIELWGGGTNVGTWPNDGKWHHLAWVRSGGASSATSYIYLDGKLSGSAAGTHPTAGVFYIAGRADNGQSWDGWSAGVRYHSIAHSADAIARMSRDAFRSKPNTLRWKRRPTGKVAAAPSGFQSAWAIGSNVILTPGVY